MRYRNWDSGNDPDCDCYPECPECGESYQPSEGHECSTDDLPIHGSRSTELGVFGGGLNTPESVAAKKAIAKALPQNSGIYDRVQEEWCFPETVLRAFFVAVASYTATIPQSASWSLEPRNWDEPETAEVAE